MNRRFFLATASVSVVVVALAGAARADGTRLDPEQIKAALRTATPEEGGFIERVVALANRGVLPRDLIDSTLLWARRKQQHKFQYFKRALIVRAAREGITL